jgi:hypothetical protein
MPVENSHPANNVMRVMPPPVAGAISAAVLHVPRTHRHVKQR